MKPYAGERYAFKRIKSDAAAMRREFSITLEWFVEQCHKPCTYCGRVDQNSLSVKSSSSRGGWIVKDFRYNGLDRVDNSIGYTEANCTPCCAVCNRAKNSMGYNEFIEYIDTLVKFRGELNNEREVRGLQIQVQWGGSKTGNDISLEESHPVTILKARICGGSHEPHWSLTPTGEEICYERH